MLLVATAFADLSIKSPVQVITVDQGDVADFNITITNLYDTTQWITVSANSTVLTAVSPKNFTLAAGVLQYAHVFAITTGVAPGYYPINVNITDNYYEYDATFVVGVTEGTPSLGLDSAYDEVVMEQGDFKDLIFVLRNDGTDTIRNVVISGDVPDGFQPEYPAVLDLSPGASRNVVVKITAPRDYPAGTYEFTIKAASGSQEVKANVMVTVKKQPVFTDALEIQRADVGPLKQGSDIVGYSLTLRVKNRAGRDMQDVGVVLGNASGWVLSGQTSFDIQRYETKDIEISIKNVDYDEKGIAVQLEKDNKMVANQTVVFSGSKIGMPTGMFYLGSSLTIGLLFVAIAVVVLLYVREKNRRVSSEGAVRDEAYLQMLADRARDEPKPPEEKPTSPTFL
jgi:uncharacterized membrane protein